MRHLLNFKDFSIRCMLGRKNAYLHIIPLAFLLLWLLLLIVAIFLLFFFVGLDGWL